MRKKFKLLVVCGDDGDATSFYRGLGPMSVLEKQARHTEFSPDFELDIQVIWGDFDFNQNRVRTVDAVFIQRPASEAHTNLATIAKKMGVPVWVDYDDDIFRIPPSNSMKFIYETKGYCKNAAECIRIADVISVTTKSLAESFRKVNDNVVVIPNAFDDVLLGKKKREPGPFNPTVLWRGSNSHDGDVLEIAKCVPELSRSYPEWRWAFVGHNPWMITKDMDPKCWKHMTWQQNIADYFDTLNRIQPALCIVPLSDNLFNHSKSNIAWIEASFANGTTLAPEWEEWKKPGVASYVDSSEFALQLDKLLAPGVMEQAKTAEISWDYIQENLKLTHVNELRRDVIKRFL